MSTLQLTQARPFLLTVGIFLGNPLRFLNEEEEVAWVSYILSFQILRAHCNTSHYNIRALSKLVFFSLVAYVH